jgi:hypothetical protein
MSPASSASSIHLHHHHQQHHQDSGLTGTDGGYTTANLQAMEAVVDIPLSSGIIYTNQLMNNI